MIEIYRNFWGTYFEIIGSTSYPAHVSHVSTEVLQDGFREHLTLNNIPLRRHRLYHIVRFFYIDELNIPFVEDQVLAESQERHRAWIQEPTTPELGPVVYDIETNEPLLDNQGNILRRYTL